MIPSFVARLSIINTLGEVLGNYLNCDLYLVKTCFESGDRLHKFEETRGRASLAEAEERRAENKQKKYFQTYPIYFQT